MSPPNGTFCEEGCHFDSVCCGDRQIVCDDCPSVIDCGGCPDCEDELEVEHLKERVAKLEEEARHKNTELETAHRRITKLEAQYNRAKKDAVTLWRPMLQLKLSREETLALIERTERYEKELGNADG